jgi:hypothetical protein
MKFNDLKLGNEALGDLLCKAMPTCLVGLLVHYCQWRFCLLDLLFEEGGARPWSIEAV